MSDPSRRTAGHERRFWFETYHSLAVALAPPQSPHELMAAVRAVGRSLLALHLPVPADLAPSPSEQEGREPVGRLHPDALARAWQEAFGSPGGKLRAVESCYRPWTSRRAPAPALAGMRGLVQSDCAQHLLALYQAAGVVLDPAWAATPDALHLELEFLALLALEGTEADCCQFLRDHLSWLPLLLADARQESVPWPYPGVLEAAVALVTADLSRCGPDGPQQPQQP